MTQVPNIAEQIETILGEDRAPLPPQRNVGEYEPRTTYGDLRPASVDEVRAIVRRFSESPDAPQLYAVSTGRNWGLGSKESATDGATRIELSGLGTIRQIDLEHGWAVIEPGVTQLDLATRLTDTSRMLNVTASSGHTSILGNALDRGVGLYGPKIDDLLGLEVVLPTGEAIRSGWWPRDDGVATPLNTHGLGASHLGLFSQSNLGIVTAGIIRLHPRPSARRTLSLTFAERDYSTAVDALRGIALNGLNRGVIKIYDDVSNQSYGGAAGTFTALLNVEGTPETVEAVSKVVRAELESSGAFASYTDSTDGTLRGDTVFDVVDAAFSGDPSHNERMLRAAVGAEAEDVDEHGGGWLFFLPYVPFDGSSVMHARELLAQVRAETGVECGSTVNALNPDVIDLVVTIRFARTAEAAERAHKALDRLYELFIEAGFPPYRLDVDHATTTDSTAASPASVDLKRQLKAVLDPHSLIAPGRYA
ncbi:FAD-binding protein [Kocuria sp. 2SI]|uniref:FAD-binding oxidoreductase n=1 Tax=Kocuria sp. 2SI TaxID=2502203 RepID=UPI0010F5D9DF|nr:FAD-binding protein [Kocuria sp. 2SI]